MPAARVSPSPSAAQPLAGLRVLDLAQYLPGALLTQWLVQLGARVIMIERPQRRHFLDLPPEHPYYSALRRGKKSIVLNLKTRPDLDTARGLVRWADVLVEGFRPGVMERLGLGPDAARELNPRLIYLRLSGFGQTGPGRDRPGHDHTYTALTGLLAPFGGRPVLPAVQIADVGGGTLPGLVALLAALWQRERTGQGVCIDLALYDGAWAWTYFLLPMHRQTPADRRWLDVFLGRVPAYRLYETQDGRWLALAALEPHFWDAFCEAVERPEWRGRAFDPDLVPEVEALFRRRPLRHWLGPDGQGGVLDPRRLSVALVRTLEEALRAPQTVARGLTAHDEHGYTHPRLPMRFDGQRPPAPRRTPHPDQDGPAVRAFLRGALDEDALFAAETQP